MGETGPISRPRVHASEWLTGLGGLVMLAGLFLPWSGGESAFEAISLLKLLVLPAGLAALAVPALVASSSRTDLPVVWETFLSTFMVLLVALLAIRLVFSPEGGLETGFFLVSAGSLVVTCAGWVAVSREG
jgi:hypothetical protein